MSFPPLSAHPILPADEKLSGPIGADVPCRRCGYNLRGLNEGGRCPECGTPIGLSTRGDFLCFADPAWVEKLVRGVRMTLWGLLVAIVFGVVASIAARLLDPLIGGLIGFAGGLLAYYGAWLLTSPDPSGIGEERYTNTRRAIRLSLLLGLMAAVLGIILLDATLPPFAKLILQILELLAGIVAGIGQMLELVYLRTLALRIPDDALAKRARFLARWFGAASLLLIAFSRIVPLIRTAAPGVRPAVIGSLGLVMVPVFLAFLVLAIVYVRFLYRTRRAFREQAALARQTWARAAATA